MTIKKINTINNMAVFNNFEWDKTVRDKGNNKLIFRKLNILYGWNYSGKTTLSRIFRALEINKITDKFKDANFQIEIEEDGIISLNKLKEHSQTVRVFNEDFVKENLLFLINEDADIKSFAILGDKNIEIESAISLKELELGTDEPLVGLRGELKSKLNEFNKINNEISLKKETIESLLKRKANDEIKPNSIYKDVNYNITKIKADIEKILKSSFKDISSEEVSKLQLLLKEESKNQISEISQKRLKFSELTIAGKALIEKKITLSNPIQELIENSLLESWVRSGLPIHKEKRSTCGFCGNELPKNLIENIENHFNKESEELRNAIMTLISKIEKDKSEIDSLVSIDNLNFYSTEKESIIILEKRFKEFITEYKKLLDQLIAQLNNRLNSISIPLVFSNCNDNSEIYFQLINEYNDIVRLTNDKTKSLSDLQSDARYNLRLHEVNVFINTIGYLNEISKISALKENRKIIEIEMHDIQIKVNNCKSIIDSLKAQLKDEKKGAEEVNKYLNNYFGHDALRLVPIDAENVDSKFKFEIQRDGEKAYHLSGGECSLISFCYFMAKLNDVNTKGYDPIIWIDDPISSLDSNHVFFIYSLINGEIAKKNAFKQLFISTHNLDFLKYLKRIKVPIKETLYLFIQRSGKVSTIHEMPDYMTKYVTEFNYLFHQIHKCSKYDPVHPDASNLFYNFGNNARKFLELLLAFKFPNPGDTDEKLNKFLGESCVESILVDRINNEYSHMEGVFERGLTPINIPEMKKAAQFILDKVYENDKDQYNSLMECVGEKPRTE